MQINFVENNPMKRILVPTDFSECALDALKLAASAAKKSNSSIDIVHVYEKPVYGHSVSLSVDNDELRKMRNNIKEELIKLAELDFLNGITIKEYMFADIEIWEMLDEDLVKGPDLVIMGTHGTTNWSEDVLGSNAEKIIRSAKVPVLVTKGSQKAHFNNIVFASSFHQETEASFNVIKNLIQETSARIHLLHVVTPSFFETTDAAEEKMEAFAKEVDLQNYTINVYNDRTIEAGIHHFSNRIKADLISMETHGRTGLAHFFSGSITEDVVNHANLPVLSMRIQEKK